MVSLEKGQKVRLEKVGGGTLKNIRMALGWDPIKAAPTTKKGLFGKISQVPGREVDVDLDASAILFDANKTKVDTVYFGQLKSRDGSIEHTGDNLTGGGDGDDESILVHLDRVPANVAHVVFVVNSYSGETFDQIENAYCRAVDTDTRDTELCRYTLSGGQKVQAMVMAKVSRDNSGWTFTAIGEPVTNGKRLSDVEPAARNAI